MKSFPVRKSGRIPGYDYSKSNFYFVTICTHEKKCIFGTVQELSAYGYIAERQMQILASHYDGICVDPFIIMPNHVHAIIQIDGSASNGVSLNQIIGSYKSGVSKKIHERNPQQLVWQRSFHDHIIRTRTSYETIYRYIKYNRQKWEDDCFHPKKSNP